MANKIIEHNVTTGEIYERELTKTEIAQIEIDKERAIKELAEQKELTEKIKADKASALAKLAALGLTEDEAKAVIGS